MRQLTRKPLDWFHPDPTQPRKDFDPEELRALGKSLKFGQHVPGLARPDGTIIDGERRWRAAKLVALDGLDVIVTDEPLTPGQVKEIQLVTALHRADLKPYELYCGCVEWGNSNPGATGLDLARKISRDPSMVSKIMSLSRCIPAIHEAVKAGLVGISDWAAMSKVDEKTQHEMLAAKLNGSSRDELERKGRKARNGLDEPKAAKVKIPFAGGSALVTCKDLVMSSLVEILEGILKEAKRAVGQFDIKTFVAMQRDKQKGAK